jgi:MULE transposase domain
MAYHWPADTVFRELTLEVEDRTCGQCHNPRTVCCHRQRRFFTRDGPVQLLCKLCHCSNPACPGRRTTLSPEAETALVMPYWVLGWDVFAWLGHRRFARHWSVPQIRDELLDRFAIPLSVDAVERYVGRYQRMLAARQHDPAEVARAYRRAQGLVLSIDGLQPEKGHETLYVVREVGQKRVWFAAALLSSSAAEVQRVLARARAWVERLGLPVRCWISDKQDAFVTGIAAEFPGVPHRYCSNHFVRDLAKPLLDADSHTKVQMRQKVRDLRGIEREVLAEQAAGATGPSSAGAEADVVLEYCAAVRGILNDNQGGPLHPPGERMAEALTEVRQSLQRNLGAKKGGPRRSA